MGDAWLCTGNSKRNFEQETVLSPPLMQFSDGGVRLSNAPRLHLRLSHLLAPSVELLD